MRRNGTGSVRCWRALVESPLLLTVWSAVVLACLAIFDVAASLRRAENVRGAAAAALARGAAETAALGHLQQERQRGCDRVRIGSVDVTLQQRGDGWNLTSEVGGKSYAFRVADLPGAAPEVFSRACSVVDPTLSSLGEIGHRISVEDLPRIDELVWSRAARADNLPALRRDRGVALLTWEMGTERDDFVFDVQRPAAQLEASGDLVVVPGHLWIEVSDQPLRLDLRKDMVLIVRGNLYVGRSIVVEGHGRLVIVTTPEPGAAIFADTDGNGRWSTGDVLRRGNAFAGPVEGAGNVYIGLPGSSAPLSVDASLVAGGEVHLAVTAHVAGPVVLPFGVTSPPRASVRLVPQAKWAFNVERERVPGFVTSGVRRPGLLRPGTLDPAPSAEQGLYLPSPAR